MNGMLFEADRRLNELPPWRIVVLSISGVLLVAAVDYVTGYEISLSVFYLGPVALAAWYAGRRASTALALLSCVSWYVANILEGYTYSHPAIPLWNAFVRFGFFVVTALLLAALRDSLKRQHDLARTDALTGIYSRRAFEERLEHDLDLARRHRSPLTLIFVDLDNFKTLNDTSGHEAGDAVLRAAARALGQSTRRVDTVARLGGDEFVVALPDTARAGAEQVAEKMQADLRQALATLAPGVTCSIGVKTFEDAPASVGEAVQAADRLMYEAKRGGKNRAAFSTGGAAKLPG